MSAVHLVSVCSNPSRQTSVFCAVNSGFWHLIAQPAALLEAEASVFEINTKRRIPVFFACFMNT